MKNLIKYINEKQNFLVKGHTISQDINITKINHLPLTYLGCTIDYESNYDVRHWLMIDKDVKLKMIKFIYKIISKVNTFNYAFFAGTFPTFKILNTNENNKNGIGWIIFTKDGTLKEFIDWNFTISIKNETHINQIIDFLKSLK